MVKIYVVTSGSYSDYKIRGIFTTKEKAELYVESFYGRIEEYSLNPYERKLSEGFKPFKVHMNIEGSTEKYGVGVGNGESDDNWFANNYENDEIHLVANMWAKDNKHAIKIANERRCVFIANNRWGGGLSDCN